MRTTKTRRNGLVLKLGMMPCFVIATAVAIGCKNSAAHAEDPIHELPPVIVGGEAPSPSAAPPLLAGTMTLGGTGCLALASAVPTISDTEILLPVETLVEKDAGSALKRGACAVALPLIVPDGYKMIVEDVSLQTDLILAAGAQVDGAVEVFTAGSIGDALDITAVSRTRPKRVQQILSLDPQLETACGAGINLRSNSSVVLKNGKAFSSAKLGAMKLTYRLEICP